MKKTKEKTKDEVKETTEKTSKNVISVSWRGNVREFSKEIHGDNFIELAQQFANKVGGELV